MTSPLGSDGRSRPHILFVTLPLRGHFPLSVHLIYRIAEFWSLHGPKYDCLVTVVGGTEDLQVLKRLQSNGDFRGVELRLVETFNLGQMTSGDDTKNPVDINLMANVTRAQFEPFKLRVMEEKKKGDFDSPTCMIADILLNFTQDAAAELGIPRIPLYSWSAWCALATLLMDEVTALRIGRDDLIPIPGLNHLRLRDVLREIWEYPDWCKDHKRSLLEGSSNIIFNTAEELDEEAGILSAFRTYLETHSPTKPAPKVYSIGPMLQVPGFGEVYSVSASPEKEACLQWLDTQSAGSVLYISFGSLGNIYAEEIRELANGLEASGVPFLWSLKSPPSMSLSKSSLLGREFLERTSDRGFILTSWAPQTLILAHPAVGGFLSHCGWNSILESVVTGVPVITWPLLGDQPMNARFITHVAKVGVPISEDYIPKQNVVNRVDVEKAIRKLMLTKEGLDLREKLLILKEKIRKASIAQGGTSYDNLQNLLRDILHLPANDNR